MSDSTKAKQSRDGKAAETDKAARMIIAAESALRERKTARLREARLKKVAEEKAAALSEGAKPARRR